MEASQNLPIKGPPSGSLSIPGRDGRKKQTRCYDQNGDADFDIDYDHGNHHDFGSPHVHDWKTDSDGKRKRGPARPPKPGEIK